MASSAEDPAISLHTMHMALWVAAPARRQCVYGGLRVCALLWRSSYVATFL
jgi:hypothetical protein